MGNVLFLILYVGWILCVCKSIDFFKTDNLRIEMNGFKVYFSNILVNLFKFSIKSSMTWGIKRVSKLIHKLDHHFLNNEELTITPQEHNIDQFLPYNKMLNFKPSCTIITYNLSVISQLHNCDFISMSQLQPWTLNAQEWKDILYPLHSLSINCV